MCRHWTWRCDRQSIEVCCLAPRQFWSHCCLQNPRCLGGSHCTKCPEVLTRLCLWKFDCLSFLSGWGWLVLVPVLVAAAVPDLKMRCWVKKDLNKKFESLKVNAFWRILWESLHAFKMKFVERFVGKPTVWQAQQGWSKSRTWKVVIFLTQNALMKHSKQA